ncbi:MAG: hypothetical protein K2J79_09580, partial [Ruminiclostridium sp.]|nr:hypothetical protein [Ruminiclostridium sp.]
MKNSRPTVTAIIYPNKEFETMILWSPHFKKNRQENPHTSTQPSAITQGSHSRDRNSNTIGQAKKTSRGIHSFFTVISESFKGSKSDIKILTQKKKFADNAVYY